MISGFCRSSPPVEEKLPGVYAVPFGWKNSRRGPFELNVSTTFAEVNGLGKGPAAGVAATLNAAAADEWPCVSPAVEIDSLPRLVPR